MDKKEIELKISENWIVSRVIIEVVGKPKKHVENMLTEYLDKIQLEKGIIIKKTINKAKKQEGDLFSTFAEIEIMFKTLNELIYFCFDYMPSSVEITSPVEIMYKARDLTSFINDLQSKLHDVNFAAKTIKQHNIKLNENFVKLLKNFVTVACVNGKSIQDLEKLTGVPEKHINLVIKALEKEQRIKIKDNKYLTVK